MFAYKKALTVMLGIEAGIGLLFSLYLCGVWWAFGSNMYDPTFDGESFIKALPFMLVTFMFLGALPLAALHFIKTESKPTGEIFLILWSLLISIPVVSIPIPLAHGLCYWLWKKK